MLSGCACAPVPARTEPDAGRAEPAEIDHRYVAGGDPAEFHVQSTGVPDPDPPATVLPSASATETVQASEVERRARKCTAPALLTSTTGSKILGPPILYAACAIAPKRA